MGGQGRRLQAQGYWRWADQSHCSGSMNPLKCYFPLDETLCRPSTIYKYKERPEEGGPFSSYKEMAAEIEYLFSKGLTAHVHREIKRQMFRVFGRPFAPDRLITVHIRWGDKSTEMKLVDIEAYVAAVKTLLEKRREQTPVHIYVASEDPLAAKRFRNAAPREWSVYVDVMPEEMKALRPSRGNHAFVCAIRSRGKAGTIALASLAISMQANEFVLTTGSNWSRLMNELRKNVIHPRCSGCTSMVDLRPS